VDVQLINMHLLFCYCGRPIDQYASIILTHEKEVSWLGALCGGWPAGARTPAPTDPAQGWGWKNHS
jgi:hypothetical protein